MSTFSTNLALELIGNGEQAGNWGQTTNTNLGTLVEQAISGYTTQAITDGADTTLTMTQGASATARNMYIELTGTLTGARNLVVPNNKKLYFIFNNTTGGFAVTVKVSGQTGVSVPNATKTILVSNGTDIVLATTPPASGVTSVAMTVPTFLSVSGSPVTSTGTLAVSLSGSALPIANGGTGSTSTAYCSLTSNVSGTLPVANGGTGSTSGVPASIVQAGTFGSGTNYLFNSSSTVAFGATNPSPTLWRMYVRTVDGNPAIVADRGSNVFSNSIVCNDDLVSSSTTRPYITFTNNGTGLASISTTDGATIVYGTGSDYRLKTNVQPLVNSTIKVKALKPCSYNWIKAPEVSGQGFLAHELAEVVPQAVVGEKDALYPDGSINIQQVDLSYVVPLLTSALQEALARIEALEAKAG